MEHVNTTVSGNGRILIPAEYRHHLGLKEGDKVSLQIEEGILKVITQEQQLANIQNLVKSFDKGNGSMVDDFLEKRKMDHDA